MLLYYQYYDYWVNCRNFMYAVFLTAGNQNLSDQAGERFIRNNVYAFLNWRCAMANLWDHEQTISDYSCQQHDFNFDSFDFGDED